MLPAIGDDLAARARADPGGREIQGRGIGLAAEGVETVARTAHDSPAPVPEPETYAMMLAGLGMLGFAAKRRKQTLAR